MTVIAYKAGVLAVDSGLFHLDYSFGAGKKLFWIEDMKDDRPTCLAASGSLVAINELVRGLS